MSAAVEARGQALPGVIDRLGALLDERALGRLGDRLRDLDRLAAVDLAVVDAAIARLPRDGALAIRSAGHLLDLGGKRLRPLCVALASRVCGGDFGPAAQRVATAVELVHSATLLHDDVVDYGEVRRGAPTARAVFGNAASIFAGDWLLVEALRLVRDGRVADTLERLLGVVHEMILGESLQLELRGKLCPDRQSYLAVVDGKTAALFAWATYAGARAGGGDDAQAEALERYGRRLGVAFQIVDDLLDFGGRPERLGKALHADLREGKTTYPLLCALEHAPALRAPLAAALAGGLPPSLLADVERAIHGSRALDQSRALAERYVAEALAALAPLPGGEATEALRTVAAAALSRDR